MVTISGENFVEKVYQQYQRGELPLDERGTSFLLGYHLAWDSTPPVGFEIGFFGPLETSFSPDLDVLATDEYLTGYEVKGYRSDNRKVTKGQLYRGLGQAITLLNQPIATDGGALRQVSLAYPEEAETDESNWQWKQNFIEALEETPIGLVTVGTNELETVVEPSENPFYNPELQNELLPALRDQATGSDIRHPTQGLENLALDIVENRRTENDWFV